MRLGRRLRHCCLVLAVGVAPLLTACGLLDRGSALDDALEYVPSDTFRLRFADRDAWADRVGVDDADDYADVARDHPRDAVAASRLAPWVEAMADAPFSDLDVEWEVEPTWGDPDDPEERASATVWKVSDDVDFDDLAADLEDKGYEKHGGGESVVYSIGLDGIDTATGLIGGTYPIAMQNVLLAEDEQVVAATAGSADPLSDIADVVGDDADSLADADDDLLDDLLGAVDDPEIADVTTAGPDVCRDGRVPADQRPLVADLGRPVARALFLAEDDDEVRTTLALRYGSEDEAQDAVDPREAYLADGRDLATGRPFADLGDFDVEQDDALLLVEEDWEGGTATALTAEQRGAGPGVCGPAS